MSFFLFTSRSNPAKKKLLSDIRQNYDATVSKLPPRVWGWWAELIFVGQIWNGARPVNPDKFKASAIGYTSFWERWDKILHLAFPKGCTANRTGLEVIGVHRSGTIPNFAETITLGVDFQSNSTLPLLSTWRHMYLIITFVKNTQLKNCCPK